MRAAVSHVAYEAEGWGVGEMWLDGERLVWHELPRSGADGRKGRHPLADRFAAYFGGARDGFEDVEIDRDEWTPFQRAVAEALRRVPYGETVTYGELAALAGHPNAQRAAGTFCAHNRFAIVIPCHRVVAAGGLGSYGSLGVAYKQRLLELEGAL
jgi:methylated-DNA-[protein]-cysteine S-methyltransferase